MLLTTCGVKPLKQFHIIISLKTPRTLNFINQFALGDQLARQT